MAYLRYQRVFTVGKDYHRVVLYEQRDPERGLLGQIREVDSPRARDIQKAVKGEITSEQKDRLASLMSGHTDGVVAPDGTFTNY